MDEDLSITQRVNCISQMDLINYVYQRSLFSKRSYLGNTWLGPYGITIGMDVK